MTRSITPAEHRKLAKFHKYGAKMAYRCGDCGGVANKSCCFACQSQNVIKFHSGAEAARYDVLRDQQSRGEIQGLELQPVYKIYIKGKLICKVILDFRYLTKSGELQVEDVKGKDTDMSRLKRKMVEAVYPFKVQVIR